MWSVGQPICDNWVSPHPFAWIGCHIPSKRGNSESKVSWAQCHAEWINWSRLCYWNCMGNAQVPGFPRVARFKLWLRTGGGTAYWLMPHKLFSIWGLHHQLVCILSLNFPGPPDTDLTEKWHRNQVSYCNWLLWFILQTRFCCPSWGWTYIKIP